MKQPRVRHPEFAAVVRHLRRKKKLSRTELADLCGVVPTAISHWEMGRSRPRDIAAFAAVFGLNLSQFYALKVPVDHGARAA